MSGHKLGSNNQLFELARQGSIAIPRFDGRIIQKVWENAYPLIAFFYAGLVPVLSSFCSAPVILVNLASEQFSENVLKNPTSSNSPIISSMFLVFSFLPFFLFIWGWLGVLEHRSFWTTGLERTDIWKKYSRGAVVGAGMIFIPVVILSLLGYIRIETDPLVWAGVGALPGVLIMLVGWLVQGAAEETLTRGFLLPVIGVRFGSFWGILVSSIQFSFLHFLNPNLNLIALLNLFLFGVFASIYAMKEGGLWGVFAIHSFWNWAQGNIFGLEVSGSTIGGTTLLNLKTNGLVLITGGAFGLEGGLLITLVLIIGCLIVIRQMMHAKTGLSDALEVGA